MDTYNPDTPGGRAMRRILQWMLDELDRGSHEVVLIDAPEKQHSTHKVRIVQNHNARWYRDFLTGFTNCRGLGNKRMKRPRPFMSKLRTRQAMERMIAGNFAGIYADRLVRYIEMFRSNRRTLRGRGDVSVKIDYRQFGIPF